MESAVLAHDNFLLGRVVVHNAGVDKPVERDQDFCFVYLHFGDCSFGSEAVIICQGRVNFCLFFSVCRPSVPD